MKPTRVVLADDHGVVRAGIRAMLKSIPGIELVGQASNGREALEFVETLQPNVILTDLSMPEMNGFEVATRITKDFPNIHVIVISMHTTEEYVWQALKAGATGYLLKDADAAELETAINTVLSGATYLTPAVSKQDVETYMQRMDAEASVIDILTPRQREILQLIAEGNALKEIAAKLNLSVKTVESHRTKLMENLQIFDVPGLVRYAMRKGLVPPEQ